MRRPVKPFVTEYKGNARRPASSAGLSLKLEDEAPSSPSRPAASRSEGSRTSEGARHAENQRFNGASQPEDSYEAALRAADALFSNAPARAAEEPSAVGGLSDKRRLDTNADGRQASSEAAVAPGGPTGGRILRVIDEAPPQVLVDLEIERTPKRRGRKPGSKNKPKLAPSFAEEPAVTRARLEASSAPTMSRAGTRKLPADLDGGGRPEAGRAADAAGRGAAAPPGSLRMGADQAEARRALEAPAAKGRLVKARAESPLVQPQVKAGTRLATFADRSGNPHIRAEANGPRVWQDYHVFRSQVFSGFGAGPGGGVHDRARGRDAGRCAR
jgi:hypothetical protein